MIWSTPLNATADISRSRSGERRWTPSTSPSSAAYMRATASGHLAASGDVGHQNVGAVAELGRRSHRPRSQLEEWGIAGHCGEHFRAAFCVLQPGQPAQLGFRNAEEELVSYAERPGHLLPEDLRDGLAGGPAHDLADDVTKRVGVVSGSGARLPPGLGVGDHGAHLVPVAQVLGCC